MERELGMAEFVPLYPTSLSFWDKMFELQYKMLVANTDHVQQHMYSADSPLDWLFLTKGTAYWLSPRSNVIILRQSEISASTVENFNLILLYRLRFT